MTDIRFDLQQYYSMKALFEKILGRASFASVKDYGSLPRWKAESTKLLRAIEVAIEATVEIVDDEWRTEARRLLEHGKSRCKLSQSIDELLASMAATFGELVFLQLGFVPHEHYRSEHIRLVTSKWKLDPVRTVQYVQSKKQLENQARLNMRKERGSKP
jgi:hypothetical protein